MARIAFLLCGLLLTACANTGPLEHAADAGFKVVTAGSATQPMTLLRPGSGPLVVVIESDGLAFLDSLTPSPDPTPLDPVGFHLAEALATALHDHAVAYVVRPCQYLDTPELRRCPSRLWLMDRFGAEAQHQIRIAIAALPQGRPITLIGISGGGVIATHLAPEVNAALITIAAPLALNDWAQHHRVTPFAPADDPLTKAAHLNGLPQLHLAGARDRTVPAPFVQSFAIKSGGTFKQIDGADHADMWEAALSYILQAIN